MYLFFLSFPKKKLLQKRLKHQNKSSTREKIADFWKKMIHKTLQEVFQTAPNLVKGWSRGFQDPVPNFKNFIVVVGEIGFFKIEDSLALP